MERNKDIVIQAAIFSNPKLNPNDMLVYTMVNFYYNQDSIAPNTHLSNLLNITQEEVTQSILKLKEIGYL